MTDENKSYKVTDRRHSTIESEAAVADGPSAEAPTGAPAEPPAETVPNDGSAAPADFTGFVLSLAQQAAMFLSGAEGHPPDLKAARWMISILEMLRDKTEGRRTPPESEVLESILYELRMVFVERSRAGGA
jgi:Domain of unknown function (DUF1844)